MVQAFQVKYGVTPSHADFEQRLEKRGPNLHLACPSVGDLWEAREALYDVSQRQGRLWVEHDPSSPTIITIIPQCVCSHCLHGRCRQCHRPETACPTPGGCRLRPGCRRCFADGFNPDHPEGQCGLLRFGYDHVDEGCSICGCLQHQAPRLDGSVQPLDTPVCPCVHGEGNLNLWLPSELVGGPVMTVEDRRVLPRSMQAGPTSRSGGGRVELPPRLDEGIMLEAASAGAKFSPGLSPAQTARAAALKGRGPGRGPRAETVLGMVAPARPQRQRAAGYGGRYTSTAMGMGMAPPPTSKPPAVLRPVPRPLGRPAALWSRACFSYGSGGGQTRMMRTPASTHQWREEMVRGDGVRSRQRQLRLSLLRLRRRLWPRLRLFGRPLLCHHKACPRMCSTRQARRWFATLRHRWTWCRLATASP